MIRIILLWLLIGIIIYSVKNLFNSPPKNKIAPNFFRFPGETGNLFFSIGTTFFVVIVLLRITFGLILIAVLAVLIMIKFKQSQLLGQGIKVSISQLPDVYEAVEIASKRLSLEEPDVYVVQDQNINAYAMGVFGNKTVVLHSKTIECMNRDELISILGHEFSHILCGHTKWIALTSSSSFIRIPFVPAILNFIFLFWHRKAEYTSDRGGLLASRNLKASTSALIKVTVGEQLYKNLDANDLFTQNEQINQNLFSTISEKFSTHPYIIKRIFELKKFYDSELYTALTAMGDSITLRLKK